MATFLWSPPSCLVCHTCLCVIFFSWQPVPLTSLPLSQIPTIFLSFLSSSLPPSSLPSFPPSSKHIYLMSSFVLGSGIPGAAPTGGPSPLETHSLAIINNFAVFCKVIDHCFQLPPPPPRLPPLHLTTLGCVMARAMSLLFATVLLPQPSSRCSKKSLLTKLNSCQAPPGMKGIIPSLPFQGLEDPSGYSWQTHRGFIDSWPPTLNTRTPWRQPVLVLRTI